MEIREGIRYEYALGKFATVKQSLSNPKEFYAVFEYDKSTSADFSISSWVKDFRSGKLKLIEYPYKVGDWVYDIENIYNKHPWNSPIISQITKIVDDKNDSRICINNESGGLSIEDFQKEYRLCFKKEIPNYKQKVVKENFDYLIPILTELNE